MHKDHAAIRRSCLALCGLVVAVLCLTPLRGEAVSAADTAPPAQAAAPVPDADTRAGSSLDDYDDEQNLTIADPLERWNRFWFRFNDIFFLYVAKPAYNAWAYITPQDLRSGLKNFFTNLLFPVRFVNNLLQFRFMEAGVEFGRFIINTTSSAGFADVARRNKPRVPVDPSGEDLGQTLGRWGMGHGFYLVWPLLGPSSARDTLGRVGDLFADPLFYLSPWELSTGVGAGLRFNAMGDILSVYDELNAAAVDPYIAMREAYVNFRHVQVLR